MKNVLQKQDVQYDSFLTTLLILEVPVHAYMCTNTPILYTEEQLKSHSIWGSLFISEEKFRIIYILWFCQKILMLPDIAIYSDSLQWRTIFLRKFNFKIRCLLVSCLCLVLLHLYRYQNSKKPHYHRKYVGDHLGEWKIQSRTCNLNAGTLFTSLLYFK